MATNKNQATGFVQVYDSATGNYLPVDEPSNPVLLTEPVKAGSSVSTGVIVQADNKSITVQLTCDQPGEYKIIYYRKDMTPAKFQPKSVAYDPNTAEPFPFPFQSALSAKFKAFEIIFSNTSNIDSTEFELSVSLGSMSQGTQQSVAGSVGDTNLAQVVKSIIQGKGNASGSRKEATITTNINKVGLDINVINDTLKVVIDEVLKAVITGTVAIGNVPHVIVDNPVSASSPTDVSSLAKEQTLASILAKLISSPATEAKQDAANTILTTIASKDFANQVTLAAVLAILGNGAQKTQVTNNDYSKESTLNLVLAKLIAAPATEGKQDSANLLLAAIRDKIIVSPATEATLSAILAKLSSDQSTATKQEAGNIILTAIRDKLITGPATEVTLAAVLAKLSSDPSTATLQTSGNTILSNILTKLAGTIMVASVPTTTGGYPLKGVYQPSGTTGSFLLIAAGVRRLGALNINNTSTGAITLLIYDKATVPVSSDVPIQSFVIPGGSSLPANLGEGLHFNNGIGFGAMGGDSGLLNIVSGLLNSITAGKFTVSYGYN